MSKRGIIVGFVAACAVPAALFAQPMSEDGVSRATDGTILHRRLPGVGGGAEGTGGSGGGAAPTAETPTFVYDPAAAGGALPRDLMRDGRPLPKPSSSPDPAADEPVHTAQGLASSKPPQAGTPPAPLPRPDPDAAEDPSLTPEPRVGANGPDASDGDRPTMPGGPATPGTSDGDAGASDPSASPGPRGDGDTAEGPPGAPPDDAADGGAAPGDEPFADPRDGLGNEACPTATPSARGRSTTMRCSIPRSSRSSATAR
ncbi:MAG: hypothetical protein U1F43_27785 [Myxococcota bacterium]